eukprot:scpid58886/ scgid34223/ 
MFDGRNQMSEMIATFNSARDARPTPRTPITTTELLSHHNTMNTQQGQRTSQLVSSVNPTPSPPTPRPYHAYAFCAPMPNIAMAMPMPGPAWPWGRSRLARNVTTECSHLVIPMHVPMPMAMTF